MTMNLKKYCKGAVLVVSFDREKEVKNRQNTFSVFCLEELFTILANFNIYFSFLIIITFIDTS